MEAWRFLEKLSLWISLSEIAEVSPSSLQHPPPPPLGALDNGSCQGHQSSHPIRLLLCNSFFLLLSNLTFVLLRAASSQRLVVISPVTWKSGHELKLAVSDTWSHVADPSVLLASICSTQTQTISGWKHRPTWKQRWNNRKLHHARRVPFTKHNRCDKE